LLDRSGTTTIQIAKEDEEEKEEEGGDGEREKVEANRSSAAPGWLGVLYPSHFPISRSSDTEPSWIPTDSIRWRGRLATPEL
jgi:hypothetical protein